MNDLIVLSGRWTAYFARNGITPLDIDYDELQRDPVGVVREIAGLVGVELRPQDMALTTPLQVQRDMITDEWRTRFIAERGDLNRLD